MVTATFSSGSGTFTATAVGGIATFTNVLDDKAETTTMAFTSVNLVAVNSTEIVVDPAAASKLLIIQPPSSTATAGQQFASQPIVEETDQFGNVITSDSTSTVTAARGSVGTASLQGSNLTVTLLDGIATFAGLSYDKAETMDINFSSSASGISSATSGDIVVSPTSATQLVIQTQPSSPATAGQAFGTQPVIWEEDKYNNLETGDNSTVVSAMQNTGKGPLLGTLNATVSGGVAQVREPCGLQSRNHHALVCERHVVLLAYDSDRGQSGRGKQLDHLDPAIANCHGRPTVWDSAGGRGSRSIRQSGNGRQQHAGLRDQQRDGHAAEFSAGDRFGRRGDVQRPSRQHGRDADAGSLPTVICLRRSRTRSRSARAWPSRLR